MIRHSRCKEAGIPEYTLRQLRYFVAAAEAGTVTQAADAVHLSQSAMSTALADLEQAFQVQLLVRHHARGIEQFPGLQVDTAEVNLAELAEGVANGRFERYRSASVETCRALVGRGLA